MVSTHTVTVYCTTMHLPENILTPAEIREGARGGGGEIEKERGVVLL